MGKLAVPHTRKKPDGTSTEHQAKASWTQISPAILSEPLSFHELCETQREDHSVAFDMRKRVGAFPAGRAWPAWEGSSPPAGPILPLSRTLAHLSRLGTSPGCGGSAACAVCARLASVSCRLDPRHVATCKAPNSACCFLLRGMDWSGPHWTASYYKAATPVLPFPCVCTHVCAQ